MAVIEALTEDEAYLLAILEDESGLDMGEFCMIANDSEDGCFRAWPFQWHWWRCEDEQQVDLAARYVGKSLSIVLRAMAFPVNFPGQDMLLTAPELIHLEPVASLVETHLLETRLTRELIKRGRSSINHRPLMIQFQNGSRIMGRIPQRDGKGVKGMHAIRLEQDEAADYPKRGWDELNETLKHGVERAQRRAHGVTKGVRGPFYDKTQPGSGWTVHRIVAMMRPTWNDEERQKAIREYGSAEDPNYRRNILGLHGDAQNVLFVLRTLMTCVDQDDTSNYNAEHYHRVLVRDTDLDDPDDEERGTTELISRLELPPVPSQYAVPGHMVWLGADIGFTSDPTEILVAVEYQPQQDELASDRNLHRAKPPKGMSRLRVIARISLRRISGPLQANVILHMLEHYNARAFSMDATGNGLPLFQLIQAKARAAAGADAQRLREVQQRIKGYNFSEKVLVDIDDVKAERTREERRGSRKEAEAQDVADEAGIGRIVLEYSTDVLRALVDQGRLMLPWDRELLDEFHGSTFSYSSEPMDQYGRRRRIFAEGRFHALDAARMLVMGIAQQPIEEFMASKPEQAPVIDRTF